MKLLTVLAVVLCACLVAALPAAAAPEPGSSFGTPAEPAALVAVKGAKRIAIDAKHRARRAIRVARVARRTARTARRAARTARRNARRALQGTNAALASAQAAEEGAARANGRLDAMAIASAAETGAVTTAVEDDFVDLGGPRVKATVPESGMVEVWATVTFDDPSDGLVALYEDGRRVPLGGQAALCGSGSINEDVLLMAAMGPGASVTLSTPPAPQFGITCGTAGPAPAPVLLTDRAPGEHTYELRYADCGCDDEDASFSQRTLRVAGRP